VDFPFDAGCASPTSPAENPAYHDGLDNDADGLADFPSDPACQTAASAKEDPKCDDGLDNDNDGKTDWDGASSAATSALHRQAVEGQGRRLRPGR
jgi:hypothetical protein